MNEPGTPDSTTTRSLAHWQRRLLPFMTGFVVAMAVAFFAFSAVHLYRVTAFIEAEHGPDIRQQVEAELTKSAQGVDGPDAFQRSLLLLEADTVDKRYHQASALLMSRIWSRQLAFITGMVMAFLGSVFILGKMSEAPSNLAGEGGGWKVAISSASPGIILSTFGTLILIASMTVTSTLDVADGPVYVGTARRIIEAASPSSDPEADRAPLSLEEFSKQGTTPPEAADKLSK